MPMCAMINCSRQDIKLERSNGFTFHKFPSRHRSPERWRIWTGNCYRAHFKPSATSVVCSAHFEEEHFDRTGQIVRLRKSAIPTKVEGLPSHLQKFSQTGQHEDDASTAQMNKKARTVRATPGANVAISDKVTVLQDHTRLCGYMLREKKARKYSFDLDDSPTEQWQKKPMKLKKKKAKSLEEFRAKERERMKNLRSNATEDQKQRNRELQKLRQAAYRARLAERKQASCTEQEQKSTTRTGPVTSKEWRRLYMREWRKRQPEAGKQEYKKKRMERYYKRRSKPAKGRSALRNEQSEASPYKTPSAVRKASSRASVSDPKDPIKYVEAFTDLDTSIYQLSTEMEPTNSVLAGLKLEFDFAEDPPETCAHTDDAWKSREPDHAALSDEPSGARFGMLELEVELKTEPPDPDLAEAEDPFTVLNIQVKKEPVSDSGDETSDNVTGSRGPDLAAVSERPSGAGFGMFGLKVNLKTPDLAEAEDPFTTLNLQVKKEPVRDSSDEISYDVTEVCDVSDTDQHSNSDPNFDNGDSNTNNSKENYKGLIENQVSKATNSSTTTSAASSKDKVCCNSSVVKLSKLLSMENKFSCHLCSSAFLKFSSLKNHMSSYHGQKYHMALAQHSVGDRSLATKPSVEEVTAKTQTRIISSCRKKRQQHFDEEDQEIMNKCLKCKFCGKDFSWLHDLKRHQRIHTGDKPYLCTDCGKAFRDSYELKRHERVHTGDRPYQCKDCDKFFNSSQNLKTHQLIHTGDKPYQCSDCSKAFSQLISLKTHQRIHTGEKPYQCRDCGKAFSKLINLKTHQRFHTGDKPYQCTDCSKAFSQSQHLKRHQRFHTGDKPFICTDCDKAFSQSNDLQRHQRIHTGDKPYHCTDCDKSFSLSHTLKTHQRIHMGDKSYHCTDCGKAFSDSSNLKRHRRIHMRN